MKKVFALLLLTSVVFSVAAQSKKVRQVLSNTEIIIEAIFGTKDSLTLEKYFAKDLVYEHSSGRVENRQQAISGIIHNQSKYKEDILPTPVNVVEKGDSIITKKVFRAVEEKADGTKGQLNITIELIWIKENGDWKLIRRKATKNL